MLLGGVRQRAARNGKLRPASCKNVGVVGAELLECRSAVCAEGHSIARSVVGIRPHFPNQASLEYRLLIWPEGGEAWCAGPHSPSVEQYLRFPVQPVCAPVGRHICAVPPDGADFLTADGLPDTLPICD